MSLPTLGAILYRSGHRVGTVSRVWESGRISYLDTLEAEHITLDTWIQLELDGWTCERPLSFYQEETARQTDNGKTWTWRRWKMFPDKGE